jgi:Flp pilus assembly protein TadD
MHPEVERAEALYLDGKADEARNCLQAVLNDDASNTEALNDLGVICFQQGQLDEAWGYFEKAFQADPTTIGPLVNLGSISFSRGQYEQALQWYQRAIDLDASNHEVMNEMAVACLELQRKNEAVAWLRKSLQTNPEQQTVLECLNKIEQAMGLELTQPEQSAVQDIGLDGLDSLSLSTEGLGR